MGNSYKNILENINSGVLISDTKERNIVYVNNATLLMLGATKEDLIGKKCFNFLCKQSGDFCNENHICESIDNKEMKIDLPNGNHNYLSLSMTEDVFENKKCYIHTFNNITDLKNIQLEKEKHLIESEKNKKMLLSLMEDSEEVNSKLRENQTELKTTEKKLQNFAQTLETKNLELDKALSDAENANEAKSKFLANMSHEIRTPLNAVLGFAELLSDTNLNETQKQYVDTINTSSSLLLSVINDILDLSKIQAGKLELDIIDVDILDFIKKVSDIIKFSVSKKNINLLLNIEHNTPRFVMFDPVRLRQILINLLSNAIKFTENGEVEIKLTHDKISENKAIFTFSIRDTGIGIKEDQKENLFKAFSQADTSTTRKFGGTGLGLIISNSLVQKMGGEILFYSTYGEGSTFYFSIEAEYKNGEKIDSNEINKVLFNGENNKKLIIEAKNNIKPIDKKFTILLAEDNITNMIVAKTIITKLFPFAKIIGAINGVDAIAKAINDKPDIIFMDIQMPEMDGIEATIKIREYEKATNNHIPIIALTAGVLEEEKKKCLNSGMDSFLTKPINTTYLKEIIEKYLEEKSLPIDTKKDIKINSTEKQHFNKKKLLDKFYNNLEIYEELINASIEQNNKLIISLENSIVNKDYKQIKFDSHAIKGVSTDMFFEFTKDYALLIEQNSNEESINLILENFNKIKEEWEKIKLEIKS